MCKTYKGVTYYTRYQDAAVVAKRFNGLVRSYTRGWAVQAYTSGPYYNAQTGAFA
jgi:hypothetical protein